MTIRINVIVVFYLSILRIFAWDQIPPLPVGRRIQYYFLHTNGNYKYGYDTGDGQTTVASSSLGNPVHNTFTFNDEHGKTQESGHTDGDSGFISRTPSLIIKEEKSNGNSLTDIGVKQNQEIRSSLGSSSHQMQDDNKPIRGHYTYTDNVGNNKGSNSGYSVTYDAHSSGSHAGDGKEFDATSANADNNKDFNNIQTNSKSEVPLATVAGDGSYSFSYETDDHFRTETADSNGNVKGSYSFINKNDNIRRVVNYEAGANKGFVTRQQYFPKNVQIANVFFSNNYDCNQQKHFGTLPDYCQQLLTKPSNDRSYSFGYKTSDASRQESSDVSGNVKGSYSFVSKDGVRRRIDYEAGANKGFIARGSHLPVPPVISNSQSAYTTATNSLGSMNAEDGQSSLGGFNDASYSFEYETSDASRQESSDVNGNVKGSYTFVSKDGIRRRVDYEAGAGKGFVARGSHLPDPPAESSLQNSYTTATNSLGSVNANEGESSVGFTDGSYTFGYETPDTSRQESSDINGNVKDSYSFVSKDGVRRKVDYEADADKGFIAKGLHLPVPPVAKSTYTTATNTLGTVKGSDRESSLGGFTDGSYSFGYETPGESRQESSDIGGNVKGSYSFVSKDGIRRNIDYEAGADKGFVARGSHLPTPPVAGIAGSLQNTVRVGQPSLLSFDDKTKKVSDFVLRTYLPPDSNNKFGYIFESSH